MSALPTIPTRDHMRPSPISRLNTDILSYVFALNANMEYESEYEMFPALVTLQHASQVCANWRQLAIRSPSLWARIINLNLLLLRGEEWMKEVLRRSGTALLHIKAINYAHKWPLTADHLVEQLLTENWRRIRSLDLQLSGDFIPDERPWLRLFERPAPRLEVFKFSWPCGPEYFLSPVFVLFSNKAPSLRTLSVDDMTIHFDGLMAANLRKLILHNATSASGLHESLNDMLLLETLEAKSAFPFVRENPPPFQHVALPRLTTIKFRVRSALNVTLAFLAHITPAKGCALEFSGSYVHESPNQDSKDLYGRMLATYSRSCTELSEATNLEAILSLNYINFSVNLPSHRRFRFGLAIETNSVRFPHGTISTLISSFTVMRFDTIRKLTLYLDNSNPVYLNPDVTKFVLAFVSVEELKTDSKTLNILQDIQRNSTDVTVPALKIIQLGFISELDQLLRVADFINARVKLGIQADALTVMIENSATVDVEHIRTLVPGLLVQTVSLREEEEGSM